MLSAVWKALAVLALAQGLDATPYVLPSVAKYQGEQVVQVLGADTAAKVQELESNVQEVFIREFRAGGMTARVSPAQVSALKKLGFDVNVVVEDLAQHLTVAMADDEGGPDFRQDDPDAHFTRYYNYMQVYEYVDELVSSATFANDVDSTWLTEKTIGKTLENRPMKAIEIGNPNATDAIYIEGTLHAREWVTTTSLQWIIRDMIARYSGGEEADLFNEFRFIFVPIVNVDGFRYSYLEERLWRKNRQMNSNESCPGVDLNRNYNGFEGWKLIEDQCSSSYGGVAAYSEPETQTMVSYLDELKAKHRIVAAIDTHSYAQFIVYPYGYDFNLPDAPNREILVECGENMAAAIKETTGKVYVVKNAADWYPGYGCADDYWYDQVVRGPWANDTGLVYTVEQRPADEDPIGFVLPPDEIIPAAKEMYAAYNALVEYARAAVKAE